MNPFFGKSIFIWNIPACFKGDPDQIALWLVERNFVSVMVKVCDGPYIFRPSWSGFPNWLTSVGKLGKPNVDKNFVDTLHRYGLKVFGWQFLYGRDAKGEGKVAAEQCIALGLDGFISDVEGEFEKIDKPGVAVRDAGKWIGAYRKGFVEHRKIPGNENYQTPPVALCYWANLKSPTGSQWHNIALAKYFMGLPEFVAVIPMAYFDWYDAKNKPIPIPDTAQEKAFLNVLAQWKTITSKPTIMAGGAYIGDGVIPTRDTILKFGAMARLLCLGVTWWAMDNVVRLPGIDKALDETPGWDEIIPPPEPRIITSVTVGYSDASTVIPITMGRQIDSVTVQYTNGGQDVIS